jgi:hypothetical protein
VSEIPLSWKLGVDITVDDVNNKNMVMRGGPTCTYNGKEIPAFFGTSPKASITSQLLADMLKLIDQCCIYDRSIATPVLLLDGHNSRMMLPFLRYINDERHKWCCCIGVPYATHIWQVGDASALNGSFKMELYRAKREYLKYRTSMKFEPTDIIPLLNKSWVKSFGNVESAKKAIAHRGWNPLNWNLLDHLPEEDVVDLTQHKEEAPSLPLLPPINVTKGVGSYYVDKILEEQ